MPTPSPAPCKCLHNRTTSLHSSERTKCAKNCRAHVQQCPKINCALYSITSLARNRMDGGRSTPMVLAVSRLTASSNLVGCSIGRSRGLVPWAIRSTYSAARRYIAVKLAPYDNRPPTLTYSRNENMEAIRCRRANSGSRARSGTANTGEVSTTKARRGPPGTSARARS
jgi:hypothetical protein